MYDIIFINDLAYFFSISYSAYVKDMRKERKQSEYIFIQKEQKLLVKKDKALKYKNSLGRKSE